MGEVVDLKQVKLTPKQMKFAEEVVYGLDSDGKPLSQSEAYRRVYSVKGSSDKVVWVESCKLAANPKVAAMITRLRQQKEVATQASSLSERDWVLQNLKAIIENPDENASARVRGLELIGKHLSLWTDTVQVNSTSSADELKQQLATRLDDLLDTGTGGN